MTLNCTRNERRVQDLVLMEQLFRGLGPMMKTEKSDLAENRTGDALFKTDVLPLDYANAWKRRGSMPGVRHAGCQHGFGGSLHCVMTWHETTLG